MRILFTADWHIKLGQKNVPKDWAINRYRSFFDQLHSIEDEVDLHIIGGDVFDRLPTLEELELYFEYLAKVPCATIIFDGNHEATKKNTTFFDALRDVTEILNDKVRVITETYHNSLYTILPYADLHKPNSIEKCNPHKALFTHVRGEIPPHVKPEVDLDRFKDFPVVFAGDLHSHSNTQRNIVYPGSPMTTSFHRNLVKTGYLLINSKDWSWTWHEFDLPQLLRKKVSSAEEMIPSDYHHTIYELEGDMQDLAKVKNSELLDKKVLKRNADATLELTKDMEIVDELVKYAKEVMNLETAKLDRIVKKFNDYSKTN
jgi:DNA repair exonuclease SbcCD nuclease subunit